MNSAKPINEQWRKELRKILSALSQRWGLEDYQAIYFLAPLMFIPANEEPESLYKCLLALYEIADLPLPDGVAQLPSSEAIRQMPAMQIECDDLYGSVLLVQGLLDDFLIS